LINSSVLLGDGVDLSRDEEHDEEDCEEDKENEEVLHELVVSRSPDGLLLN